MSDFVPMAAGRGLLFTVLIILVIVAVAMWIVSHRNTRR